jgi:transcriptional regulator with XRE-family HTH domain
MSTIIFHAVLTLETFNVIVNVHSKRREDSMNNRIREIRRDVGLTQEGFAARLNLTRNFIAQVEMGTKEPSDRTIRDICREFGYREEWLRTGDGEPKADGDRAEEVKARVEKLFRHKNAEFQQALISTLLQFEPDGPQWRGGEENL